MNNAERVANAALAFYRDEKCAENGPHGRFLSWEHCYLAFRGAREGRQRKGCMSDDQYDYLSLHLAFYLASWGMYRGSSFLLSQDYKVHKDAVIEILNEKYDPLQDVTCRELNDRIELLFGAEGKTGLCWELRRIYERIRDQVVGKNVKCGVSDTLITKILMGTLGCVPAYDRYFVKGIKVSGVATSNFNKNSISTLAGFYNKYYNTLEKVRKGLRTSEGRIEYPQMKLLDMGFWQMGKQIENDKKETQQ